VAAVVPAEAVAAVVPAEAVAAVVPAEAAVAENKAVGAAEAAGNKAEAVAAGNKAAGAEGAAGAATGIGVEATAAATAVAAAGDTIPGAGCVTSAIGPIPTESRPSPMRPGEGFSIWVSTGPARTPALAMLSGPMCGSLSTPAWMVAGRPGRAGTAG
jgi:hypothetical protein